MTVYRYVGGLPLKNYVKRVDGITVEYDARS